MATSMFRGGRDSDMIVEEVTRLQRQLTTTREALLHTEDQLSSVLGLVRRAWTGDSDAAKELADLVGVPAPLLQHGHSDIPQVPASTPSPPYGHHVAHHAAQLHYRSGDHTRARSPDSRAGRTLQDDGENGLRGHHSYSRDNAGSHQRSYEGMMSRNDDADEFARHHEEHHVGFPRRRYGGNNGAVPAQYDSGPLERSYDGSSPSRHYYFDNGGEYETGEERGEPGMPEVEAGTQLMHMRERLDYFDNVLKKHVDMLHPTQPKQGKKGRLPSAKGRPQSGSRLRRSHSASSAGRGEGATFQAELCVGDLLSGAGRASRAPSAKANGRILPSEKARMEIESGKPPRANVRRKSEGPGLPPKGQVPPGSGQSRLFSSEGVVQRKTPALSASTQKAADRMRARPRSAASSTGPTPTSSGRPMRYETTRPTSVKTAPSPVFGRSDREAATSPTKAPRGRMYPARPSSVDEFVEGEAAMRSLEKEFEKSTMELQRRLGIETFGMVTP